MGGKVDMTQKFFVNIADFSCVIFLGPNCSNTSKPKSVDILKLKCFVLLLSKMSMGISRDFGIKNLHKTWYNWKSFWILPILLAWIFGPKLCRIPHMASLYIYTYMLRLVGSNLLNVAGKYIYIYICIYIYIYYVYLYANIYQKKTFFMLKNFIKPKPSKGTNFVFIILKKQFFCCCRSRFDIIWFESLIWNKLSNAK